MQMRITEGFICLEGVAFANNLEGANLNIEYSYANQRKKWERLQAYYQFFLTKSEKKLKFWEWESEYERKIFDVLRNRENRHPIIAILVCAVLGGVLISLIAGIILEVGIEMFLL